MKSICAYVNGSMHCAQNACSHNHHSYKHTHTHAFPCIVKLFISIYHISNVYLHSCSVYHLTDIYIRRLWKWLISQMVLSSYEYVFSNGSVCISHVPFVASTENSHRNNTYGMCVSIFPIDKERNPLIQLRCHFQFVK